MIILTLTLLLIFFIICLVYGANRSISSLLTVNIIGYGGSIKGHYGFITGNQQATIEVDYHRFPIKYPDLRLQYSALPLYVGYRYIYNRLVLEPQLGLSVNRIDGSNGVNKASTTLIF